MKGNQLEIVILATELRPGDIFQGRRIVGVTVGQIMTNVRYESGNPTVGYGAVFLNITEMMVKRETERIEQ